MFNKISFLSLLAMIAAMLIFMPQATLANCDPDAPGQCTPQPVPTIEVDIVEIPVNLATNDVPTDDIPLENDQPDNIPPNNQPPNEPPAYIEVAEGLISIQAEFDFTLTSQLTVPVPNMTFTLTPLASETFPLMSSGTKIHLYQIKPAPNPAQYQPIVDALSGTTGVVCASYSFATGSPNTATGASSSALQPVPHINHTDFDDQWIFNDARGINKANLLDSQQGQDVQIAIIDQFEIDSDQARWTTVFLAPEKGVTMNQHGTLVTSLVQAVAPQSSQIAAPVLNLSGRTHSHALIKSINQLIQGKSGGLWPKLRVVNMSLGFKDIDDCTKGVLDHLLAQGEQQDIVFVAAAGNDSDQNNKLPSNYPASSEHVIGIGATDNKNQPASYSNEGEIYYAPGGDCEDPNPDECTLTPDSAIIGWTPIDPDDPDTREYWLITGTSFATPLVSALAADILSCNNSLAPGEVRAAIQDYANQNIIDMQATLASVCP